MTSSGKSVQPTVPGMVTMDLPPILLISEAKMLTSVIFTTILGIFGPLQVSKHYKNISML